MANHANTLAIRLVSYAKRGDVVPDSKNLDVVIRARSADLGVHTVVVRQSLRRTRNTALPLFVTVVAAFFVTVTHVALSL